METPAAFDSKTDSAKPDAKAAAAALWRSLRALAAVIDPRDLDDGAVINLAHCHGAVADDIPVIEAYVTAELSKE